VHLGQVQFLDRTVMQLRCEALLLAFFDQRDLIRQGPQAFVGLLKESIRVLQLGG
jgi:hypothetical protein